MDGKYPTRLDELPEFKQKGRPQEMKQLMIDHFNNDAVDLMYPKTRSGSGLLDSMSYTPSEKQHRFDIQYMRMARIWSENSYAKRRQVGCLIVKDNMIISDGYNGTPSGFPNVCEDENNKTFPYVLHAEANAITKLARSGNSADGATLYVTCEPCIECAKLIIQAGIIRVVYDEEYHTHDGLELLKRTGIEVNYLKH